MKGKLKMEIPARTRREGQNASLPGKAQGLVDRELRQWLAKLGAEMLYIADAPVSIR